VFTYIECLGRAVYCCKFCAKTADKVSKDEWRRKMLDCCAEAEMDMKELWTAGDADQEEAQRLHLFLLSMYDLCTTCSGKEMLIYPMIEKEWIDPYVSELEILRASMEDEQGGRKKKQGEPVTMEKVVSFDFVNKTRL
jgi:hypothetical protein